MRTAAIATLLTAVLGMAFAGAIAAQSPAAQSPAATPGNVIDQVSVVILQLRDPEGRALGPDRIDAAWTVIEARLASLPAPGATLTAIPGDRIRIDLADPSQLETVTRVASAPGVFRIVGIPSERAHEVGEGLALPDDMEVSEIVGPGHVVHASVGQAARGLPAVDLQLDAMASDTFDAWAADHFGEMAALVLDDIVVTAATIQATDFNGRAQISGSFDPPRIQELVAILSGGALPVVVEPMSLCLPAACPRPGVSPGVSAAPR